MQASAHLQAAIEVLTLMQPTAGKARASNATSATTALKEWGRQHRFAGAKDRSAIGDWVYQALRFRASSSFLLDSHTPRAWMLGAMRQMGLSLAQIDQHCQGGHTPAPLVDRERQCLAELHFAAASDYQKANLPEWLMPSFARQFGDTAVDQARALCQRATVSLRINTEKTTQQAVQSALADWQPIATNRIANCLSFAAPEIGTRAVNLSTHPLYLAGHFEIQDEASQIAARLADVNAEMRVLDLCAGAGGKTLALSNHMRNRGVLVAFDTLAAQQHDIHARIERAGANHVQVINAGDHRALQRCGDQFDVVLVDAPCTGSGTWRRTPDTKWRLQPQHLAERVRQQREVLLQAAAKLRHGGRLVYVTCSLLPEENQDQVDWFLSQSDQFKVLPWRTMWQRHSQAYLQSADRSERHLLMTPLDHGTDGFFVALFERL